MGLFGSIHNRFQNFRTTRWEVKEHYIKRFRELSFFKDEVTFTNLHTVHHSSTTCLSTTCQGSRLILVFSAFSHIHARTHTPPPSAAFDRQVQTPKVKTRPFSPYQDKLRTKSSLLSHPPPPRSFPPSFSRAVRATKVLDFNIRNEILSPLPSSLNFVY